MQKKNTTEAKKHFLDNAKDWTENFVIDKENEEVLEILLYYFNDIKSHALDPKKGICLYGNVGSGKTMMMKIMRNCNCNIFGFKTCRQLSEVYAIEGFEGLRSYGKQAVRWEYSEQKFNHLLIDDLGAENDSRYYGHEINVMSEILLDRYEFFISDGLITNLTTNLSKEEISDRYSYRVYSRMQEMFNFLKLGGSSDAKDRRFKEA